MKRPQLTLKVVSSLGAMRAKAQIAVDNGAGEAWERARLKRAIKYIDALRNWFWFETEREAILARMLGRKPRRIGS